MKKKAHKACTHLEGNSTIHDIITCPWFCFLALRKNLFVVYLFINVSNYSCIHCFIQSFIYALILSFIYLYIVSVCFSLYCMYLLYCIFSLFFFFFSFFLSFIHSYIHSFFFFLSLSILSRRAALLFRISLLHRSPAGTMEVTILVIFFRRQ